MSGVLRLQDGTRLETQVDRWVTSCFDRGSGAKIRQQAHNCIPHWTGLFPCGIGPSSPKDPLAMIDHSFVDIGSKKHGHLRVAFQRISTALFFGYALDPQDLGKRFVIEIL